MWKKWVEFVVSLPQLNHKLTENVFKIAFIF